jgi:cbb3-type cytochrome oxidase subunit 3
LRETTGSFAAAFLLIPVILLILTLVVWMYSPEHARKELDAISV